MTRLAVDMLRQKIIQFALQYPSSFELEMVYEQLSAIEPDLALLTHQFHAIQMATQRKIQYARYSSGCQLLQGALQTLITCYFAFLFCQKNRELTRFALIPMIGIVVSVCAIFFACWLLFI